MTDRFTTRMYVYRWMLRSGERNTADITLQKRLVRFHASIFVAKSYMGTVDRQVYHQDVRLQMDAKIRLDGFPLVAHAIAKIWLLVSVNNFPWCEKTAYIKYCSFYLDNLMF